MDLSRGWYVTTNGTPFSTFALWKILSTENLTLLVSVSMSFGGILSVKTTISFHKYFSKYFSSEPVRLSFRAWL